MAGQAPRKASLLDAVRTVLSAFLGVRRRAAHEQDTRHIRPVHIVIVAVVLVASLIVSLVTLVHWVTGQ